MKPGDSLRYLKGVGERRAAALEKLGVATVEDLLYVLPFRHEDRREFAQVAELGLKGRETTIDVTVESARLIRTRRRGFTIFEAVLRDRSGAIRAVWYNQPYLERVFREGRRAVVFGRASVSKRGGHFVLENPDYEMLEEDDADGIHTGRIVPVYRKLGDLTSRMQRAMIHAALAAVEGLPDLIPEDVARRSRLLPRLEALRLAHFPAADTSLDELAERRTRAQKTLAFEEIFLLQLALARRMTQVQEERRRAAYELTDALRTRLGTLLPFKLTEAQKRVLREIGADLRSPHPMNRLLQGDVGSGKTIVALLTMLVAVENGHQAALLVPTEILADQHFKSLSRILKSEYVLGILTGSQKTKSRRMALEGIRTGRYQIVVGTHALFEEGVEFKRLGLVVVDEQHRFGVLQRRALQAKGESPDVLVMTATPIPRSLALTAYGDLELSVIDELPPGRIPIATVVRGEPERKRVYDALRQEVATGRQAYVVVPLVEETEKSDLKAATAFAGEVAKLFPTGQVGLVHGRMAADERDRVMAAFVAGTVRVLVATTVIEVGVDVPNASVMIVEHAERFGLSQLHQLRGRVGRGGARSYCVLMVADEKGKEASERLKVMAETTDGFKIAEKDLELRGPGAVFGTQQHGLTDLQFLSVILRDPGLIETARKEAQALLAATEASAHRLLAACRPSWRKRMDLAGVG